MSNQRITLGIPQTHFISLATLIWHCLPQLYGPHWIWPTIRLLPKH